RASASPPWWGGRTSSLRSSTRRNPGRRGSACTPTSCASRANEDRSRRRARRSDSARVGESERFGFVEIIPAIDILGGKCVRLAQGDYSRETVFSDDPVAMALRWASMGADRIHVVDLDGAKSGTRTNGEVIADIVDSVS